MAMTTRSPFSLLQEELRDDPWKLLVACVLLNRTSHKQVRPLIDELFEAYPSASAMADADVSVLAQRLKPLGLYNRRASTLVKLSNDYCQGEQDVACLYGVGKYALDSYKMFVECDVNGCAPTDKKLIMYRAWWDEQRD